MTGRHTGRGRLARAWDWWQQPPEVLTRGQLLLIVAWFYSAGQANDAGIRTITIVGSLWLLLTVVGLLVPLVRWLWYLWRIDRRLQGGETAWQITQLAPGDLDTVGRWLDTPTSIDVVLDNTHARFTPEGTDPE